MVSRVIFATKTITLLSIAACTVQMQVPVSPTPQGETTRIFVESSTGLRFVLVPAGSFTMGSQFAKTLPESERRWFIDESPERKVSISRDFWLADTETTVAAFRHFVDETGYVTTAELSGQSLGSYEVTTDPKGVQSGQWAIGANLNWRNPGWNVNENHPVTHVSWHDAAAFVQWLRDKTGRPFRLPTEAEWEYAAGGPDHTIYSWGNDEPKIGLEGNIADATFSAAYPLWKYPVLRTIDDLHVHTAPVGSFAPNGFGLNDMTGNVWEWCADRYSSTYYASAPNIDPTGAADGAERVHRGGGFDWELPYLRVAKRRHGAEELAAANIGFRVALSLGSALDHAVGKEGGDAEIPQLGHSKL